MARVDHELVGGAQPGAVLDAAQVGVGEVVRPMTGCARPLEKRQVVALEVRRRASVQEGPSEPPPALVPACVPRVAATVAVGIAEVVGLPGLGRDDDGDRLGAEDARGEDERRVADPAARGQLREVDTAWPVPIVRRTVRRPLIAPRWVGSFTEVPVITSEARTQAGSVPARKICIVTSGAL